MSSPLNVIQLEFTDDFGRHVWTMIDQSVKTLARKDGSFSFFIIYCPNESADKKGVGLPVFGVIPFQNAPNCPDPINLAKNREEKELYYSIKPLKYPPIDGTNSGLDTELLLPGDTLEIHIETIPYLIYRMRIRDKIASQWISCGLEGDIDFYLLMNIPNQGFRFLGADEKALYELSEHRDGILDETICNICHENVNDHSSSCGHMFCYACVPNLLGKCPICARHDTIFRVRYLSSLCAVDKCFLRHGDIAYCALPCGCAYGKCLPQGLFGNQRWEIAEQIGNKWKLVVDPRSGNTPSCLRCRKPVTDLFKLYWD